MDFEIPDQEAINQLTAAAADDDIAAVERLGDCKAIEVGVRIFPISIPG